ncbi:hypothetical protein J6590_033770 [Homalodisca vitripennis]|nr:hypothetical protein J6590_033770 [Homalodisca vitripennis]
MPVSSILWPFLGQRTRDRIWDKPCETESGTEFFRERLRVTAPRESPRMSSLSRHRADTTRCYCKYASNRHTPRQHRAARLLNRHPQAIGTRLVITAPRDC